VIGVGVGKGDGDGTAVAVTAWLGIGDGCGDGVVVGPTAPGAEQPVSMSASSAAMTKRMRRGYEKGPGSLPGPETLAELLR
jgi:hypothetical protein